METTNEKIINQLNDLIRISNDRIAGYEKAEKETNDPELRPLFRELGAHSLAHRNELANEVRALGGTPAEGTTASGKVFRAWMDIKAALAGKDRKAIISSCETGEDAALETYTEALESGTPLPEKVRAMVLKQKQDIQRDHDRIRSMREEARVKQ